MLLRLLDTTAPTPSGKHTGRGPAPGLGQIVQLPYFGPQLLEGAQDKSMCFGRCPGAIPDAAPCAPALRHALLWLGRAPLCAVGGVPSRLAAAAPPQRAAGARCCCPAGAVFLAMSGLALLCAALPPRPRPSARGSPARRAGLRPAPRWSSPATLCPPCQVLQLYPSNNIPNEKMKWTSGCDTTTPLAQT